jgi:hypothetical protein
MSRKKVVTSKIEITPLTVKICHDPDSEKRKLNVYFRETLLVSRIRVLYQWSS